jgi:phenylpropionate dioxygenase-like ring-hydroxylating dioxygenase large terminal subunit
MSYKNDGLPQEAYTDAKFFELEQKVIFSNTWAYGGLIEDVAQPGDFITVQAGLNNIIVIMGRDYRLRAFHNMCRHRGTQLLHATGKAKKSLTCPYHDWTYDLEGNLLSLPKEHSEFSLLDKSCLGLKHANVDCWRGMIWVHPDANSMVVSEWFKGLEAKLGPHNPEALLESKDDKVVKVIKANWKIVVENYIDHYHLAQLHSGTLNMYDHAKAEFGFVGDHFTFWEPLEAQYASKLKQSSPLPLIDNLPADKLGAWVPMIFPGIGLSETESSWSVFHIIPLAADKTRVEIRTKTMAVSNAQYALQSARSTGFWQQRLGAKYADLPQSHPLGSADFMQEDIYVCEQQQKSLGSPYFSLGPSASLGEAPIREHQKVVWRYIKPYWQHISVRQPPDFVAKDEGGH